MSPFTSPKLRCLPLFLCLLALLGQTFAADPQKTSIKDSLARARSGTKLHIFYVHGIGINPPKHSTTLQNFETSQEFRQYFCRLLKCVSVPGSPRYYANQHAFDPAKDPPNLKYLGADIWRPGTEDWRAAAPFVDHYNLSLPDGTIIYLHEINWWPLVMAAKCRDIVATDSALVDHDDIHSHVCAVPNQPDGQRFRSYNWFLTAPNPRNSPWPQAASINRWAKHDILDWGFADALLAVGPLHKYLVEGIRETVLASFDPADNEKQEFVVVSHSLGSYLMFSALDLAQPDPQVDIPGWKTRLGYVLRNTSHAYFMANQLSLLELANLDDPAKGNLFHHLSQWADSRRQAAPNQPASVVAFSDPDDLLTWKVPDSVAAPDDQGNAVTVMNCPVLNARRFFWTFANPQSAHISYDKNKRVLQAMIPKEGPASNKCPTQ